MRRRSPRRLAAIVLRSRSENPAPARPPARWPRCAIRCTARWVSPRSIRSTFATRRLWSWRDEWGAKTYWQERIGRAICAVEGAEGFWPLPVDPKADSGRAAPYYARMRYGSMTSLSRATFSCSRRVTSSRMPETATVSGGYPVNSVRQRHGDRPGARRNQAPGEKISLRSRLREVEFEFPDDADAWLARQASAFVRVHSARTAPSVARSSNAKPVADQTTSRRAPAEHGNVSRCAPAARRYIGNICRCARR